MTETPYQRPLSETKMTETPYQRPLSETPYQRPHNIKNKITKKTPEKPNIKQDHTNKDNVTPKDQNTREAKP